MKTPLSTLLVLACVTSFANAQPNAVPGTNVKMLALPEMEASGRKGLFPTGRNGLAMETIICNKGTTSITWLPAMNRLHPVYGFLVCREHNGRFEQISDRSYVKHGTASGNENGCGPCGTFSNTLLGPSCSDTYDITLNRDRFTLGPATEIDPWLATWQHIGSHFDRGEPDVGPPQNMDGQRSLTRQQVNVLNPARHRIEVDDADLQIPGARYFYAAQVVIKGEPESVRDNNMMSQRTVPSWNGSRWLFNDQGSDLLGSVLQNWAGATLDSGVNGSDDGGSTSQS